MSVMLQNGNVLLVNGNVAVDPNCCCGACDPNTVPVCTFGTFGSPGSVLLDGIGQSTFSGLSTPGVSCTATIVTSGFTIIGCPIVNGTIDMTWDGTCWICTIIFLPAALDACRIASTYRLRICTSCPHGTYTIPLLNGDNQGVCTVVFP